MRKKKPLTGDFLGLCVSRPNANTYWPRQSASPCARSGPSRSARGSPTRPSWPSTSLTKNSTPSATGSRTSRQQLRRLGNIAAPTTAQNDHELRLGTIKTDGRLLKGDVEGSAA